MLGWDFYDDAAVLRPLTFPVRIPPPQICAPANKPQKSLARQAEFGEIGYFGLRLVSYLGGVDI